MTVFPSFGRAFSTLFTPLKSYGRFLRGRKRK